MQPMKSWLHPMLYWEFIALWYLGGYLCVLTEPNSIHSAMAVVSVSISEWSMCLASMVVLSCFINPHLHCVRLWCWHCMRWLKDSLWLQRGHWSLWMYCCFFSSRLVGSKAWHIFVRSTPLSILSIARVRDFQEMIDTTDYSIYTYPEGVQCILAQYMLLQGVWRCYWWRLCFW